MKTKYLSRFSFLVVLSIFICYGCNEIELEDTPIALTQELSLSSRSTLSKYLLDSVNIEESKVDNSINEEEGSNARINATTTLVNYALQATATAESTFPGYSVQKIKDGSRTTTVGPSYSWANNYPAGGRLPESVFLKFSSMLVA